MRGLSFEIPNQYGRYFYDILEDININKYFWKSGDGEAYNIENNELGAAMFPHPYTYNGEDFYNQISAKDYYVIFADLKAFKEKTQVQAIATYEDFLISQCEIVLLIVDSSYVTIYVKDQYVTERLYRKAVQNGYENIAYITDHNDPRTALTLF
ncbi:DUF2691 family protein [Solibacillus sp. FSL W7-1436]|uniref:DUF2691 family protein n=1 Tax=Solibacillus sp. FSL W7-1436 TaxID=2921705 RepID=UPI0030F5364E